jgi:hypothetical protein
LSGRDRRIHARLSPQELSTRASIRIANHPAISLVDLSPVVDFDHLLMWVLDAARRGERSDRIAAEIQLRLTK